MPTRRLHLLTSELPDIVSQPAMSAAEYPPALVLPRRNRLLGELRPADRTGLPPHLELVQLEHHGTFFEPAEPIDFVFFPETAVVSFVNTFADGGTGEVGTAGCEGMVGLPVFLGESI